VFELATLVVIGTDCTVMISLRGMVGLIKA
jgi:hypothetical protein